MSANVETMFYVREKPWHGLGTEVQEAPTSADALIYAGLDWEVLQKDVYAEDGSLIPGYKVNTRSTDNAALGIVSDRYKVVQNEDAFQFTDDLLGAGVSYETAGSLQGGRKVWIGRLFCPLLTILLLYRSLSLTGFAFNSFFTDYIDAGKAVAQHTESASTGVAGTVQDMLFDRKYKKTMQQNILSRKLVEYLDSMINEK